MLDIFLHHWATYVYLGWLLVLILGNVLTWKTGGSLECRGELQSIPDQASMQRSDLGIDQADPDTVADLQLHRLPQRFGGCRRVNVEVARYHQQRPSDKPGHFTYMDVR